MRSKQSVKVLFKAITEYTIVLTPNRRLSATLHKLYQQQKIEQEQSSWPTPTILPLMSWLQNVWLEDLNQYVHTPMLLLNPTQEQFIWEKILSKTKESSQLLQISSTATIANSAFQLLRQWQVDLTLADFKLTDDCKTFQEWAMQFQATCEKNAWVDIATLPTIIANYIEDHPLLAPKRIMLVGFAEISPQLNHLFSVCQKSGCIIEKMSMSNQHGLSQRLTFLDNELEIMSMANWAKSMLREHPDATIGCVISSLDRVRNRVMQLFSEVFSDENTYTIDPQTNFFNVSAGKPLIEYPIIEAAIQILSLHKKIIHTELFSYLLSSPFLGDAQKEFVRRAHFDRFLRQHNLTILDISKLAEKDFDFSLHKTCPHLAKRMQAFLLLFEDDLHSKTYYQWALLFNQLLKTIGWPGERSLNSTEYQVVNAWLKLLKDFQSLDQLSSPVSFSYALYTLTNMANNSIFQPKTPDAPIQVLGTLEASGLSFDYLWISGLDNQTFPPKPNPNPFIPKSIQRELNMPHATAERELQYCKQLVDEFNHSANQIFYSYAEKQDDIHVSVSTLIEEIAEIKLEQLNLPTYLSPSLLIFENRQIEYVNDEIAPPVNVENQIQGGVSIIQQQALCPFKAFAEWRLHAKNLESRLPGLRNKDRGTLIHNILEMIWNEIKDHHTLLSMASCDLDALVHRSISKAITRYHLSYQYRPNYLRLEEQCLFKLISEWLNVEKNRPPFKVLMHESKSKIQLDQLTLNVRIDRIDELENGKKLIIDYKTSKKNNINHWFGDRPEEPQLPIYALDDIKVVGISFASVGTHENCFKGVSHYSLEIDGIKLVTELHQVNALSWTQQLEKWHETFTQLAHDFSQGIAKVDPKHPQQTCTFCSLKPLCRIHEENRYHVNG